MNLSEALLGDYLYCKKNDEYILDQNGWFKKTSMKETIELIYRQIINGYQKLDKSEKILAPGFVFVDRMGLSDVLLRYSRDIFGQKRLESQI